MGLITSRFSKKRVEETTLEKLAKLESRIRSFEDHIQQDRRREKTIWAGFLFTTGFLYVSAAGILHLFILERNTVLDIAKLVLLWIAPLFIIYFLQRWIPWYFERGIQEQRLKLRKLREEKKAILDDVRENEPYNKAKAILEKYEGPQAVLPRPTVPPQQPMKSQAGYAKMPVTSYPGNPPRPQGPAGGMQQNRPYPAYAPQLAYGRPPVRRERSTLDRMLDYVVKDGPENRMALICRACGAHNGLVLLDEFEYTGFKCFECHTPNPSRKPRPSLSQAAYPTGARPSLPVGFTATQIAEGSGSGSSSSGSEEDSTVGESGDNAVHHAVSKLPVVVQDAAPVSSVATVTYPDVNDGDTGSESDNEGEEEDGTAVAASALVDSLEQSGVVSEHP